MTYKIRCYVSGGITGSRQAWLKEHGNEFKTDDKKLAETTAKHLRNTTGKNPYSMAQFDYRVVEMF